MAKKRRRSKKKASTAAGKKWGALKKSWTGFRIAKAHKDGAKMVKYKMQINKIQRELKIKQTKFRRR